MKSSELWEKFITKYPAKAHCPHDAWAFGAQPTKLAQLSAKVKKRRRPQVIFSMN
ncbi:hypothetical protein [Ligilactobacillus apodemi]|uniref:hypothetical protein n=1 Tax=Ligilactobacillus apodemi TaxID=307126 RepID=UPI001F48DC86|nr:hypothetical protein [Ligilactobacillus apodemi]